MISFNYSSISAVAESLITFWDGPPVRFPKRFEDVSNINIEEFEKLLWRYEFSLEKRLLVIDANDEIIPLPRRRKNKDLFRWAIDSFLRGNVLVIEDVHEIEASLALLTCEFSNLLLAHTTANICLLPKENVSASFGLSRDDCNIILQTNGMSRWVVGYKYFENNTYLTIDLDKGELLYLPKNTEVFAVTNEETAIFVTFSMKIFTSMDLLDALIEVSTELDPELRKSVPEDGTLNSFWEKSMQRIRKYAQSDIIINRAMERVRLLLADEHRPNESGFIRSAEFSDLLNLDDQVQLSSGFSLTVSERENALYVYIPGLGGVSERESQPSGLLFPLEARPLLDAIGKMKGAFSANDLSSKFSAQSRLVTVRRLLREGGLQLLNIENTYNE